VGEKLKFRFGTDGVRGIIDKDFNERLVAVLAESTTRYWSRRYGLKHLLVGYDVRTRSRTYATIVANVALNHGIDTVITGKPTPTPVVAWFGFRFGFDLIIQITASHNPPIYNGFKVISRIGAPAQEEDTNQIEKTYQEEAEDINKSVSKIEIKDVPTIDPSGDYVSHVINDTLRFFKPRTKLRVLVDPLFGTSIGYTGRILRELGMDVVETHNYYDDRFGGRNPNPEPDNIPDTIQQVTSGAYDAAVAHDCDADRIGAVDPRHGYLSPNNIITIVINELARRGIIRRGIIRSTSTTNIVDAIASKYGLRIYEVPVGFKHAVKYLVSGEADVAGEESSGLAYSWHVPDKDGIYTASLLIAAASEYGSLSGLFDEIIREYGVSYFRRVDLPVVNGKEVVDRNKDLIIERLRGVGRVVGDVRIDGVKALFDDGSWVLIRGSGTEPLVRIYAEAHSAGRLNEIISAAVSIIQSLK
jgi:phosphomannomutase